MHRARRCLLAEESFTLAGDGAIEAVVTLSSGPRRITAEQFEATRKSLAELAERDFTPLYFVHEGLQLLNEGQTAEGLRKLNRLALGEPGVALHRARLAQGLLSVGLGEKARAAARRAVEIDPDSFFSRNTLGWVLQHDLVGRRWGPGFDLEGAVAAYRGAKELEDFNLNAWLNLAILLEHDDTGRRYSPQADLDGAISEYLAARDEYPDEFTFDHNLLVAMLWDRRFEEIVSRFPDLGDDLNEDVIVLTALAATDSVAEAHRRARIAHRDAGTVRSILVEMAQLLGQQRLYARAGEAFRLAAKGADDPTSILSRAMMLENTRRIENLEPDLSTAQGVVQQAFVLAGEPDGDERIRAELLSPRVVERLDQEGLEAAGLLLAKQVRASSRQLNLPPKVLIDLTIGGMEWIVEGRESAVRRVHLRSLSGDSSLDTTAFVHVGESSPRLLCVEDDASVLGLIALDHLEAGNLAGARELLDWARELTVSYDSGDPLDGSPFARLWQHGADHDAATARLAALVLVADGPFADEVMERLQRALDDPACEDHTTEIMLALVSGHLVAEDFEQVAAVARTLSREHPSSRIAFAHLTGALIELKRTDEVIALAEERLERRPADIFGLRILSTALQQKGELVRADEMLGKVVTSSDAVSVDFNNRAWLSLFLGSTGDQALMWASSAAKRAEGGAGDHATLHTLATLFAQREMPAEAYQVIVQAMDPNEGPQNVDWYVFGRMAESYGFDDAARRAYARVLEDDEDSPVSTAALARRRLKGLDDRLAALPGNG